MQTHVPAPPAWRRLPPKHEHELVVAAEGGDAKARARLVEAFLPAIGGVARMYRNSTAVDRGELMQEGVVGLPRDAMRVSAPTRSVSGCRTQRPRRRTSVRPAGRRS